ncbi:protein of unknown function [Denitratisoma oestradiolicum]|uniref:Uncharacterized protein n=1 Tax=Denitratisoma oestradiolicum TaxID=311182 RepID=A0A6S6XXU6_9PROT|nr:protein of unknown function [Denitratisoma oestradiolicum]
MIAIWVLPDGSIGLSTKDNLPSQVLAQVSYLRLRQSAAVSLLNLWLASQLLQYSMKTK